MRLTTTISAFIVLLTIGFLASCGGDGQPRAESAKSPDLALSPGNINFGMQIVGKASATQEETLTSTGSSVLTFKTIEINGKNGSDFAQESSSCGSTLSPDQICTVEIAFMPSQLGPRVASLTISDDSSTSPHSVSINGVGVVSGPNATLSTTALVFNTQNVDTTSSAQSITVSNYGNAALDISSITTSSDFSETDNCPPTLAPTASCSINVTFTPDMADGVSGTITLRDDAPDSPQTVSLSGTGSGGMCVTYGRQCGSTQQCCPGLKCEFSGGSSRVGYSCR